MSLLFTFILVWFCYGSRLWHLDIFCSRWFLLGFAIAVFCDTKTFSVHFDICFAFFIMKVLCNIYTCFVQSDTCVNLHATILHTIQTVRAFVKMISTHDEQIIFRNCRRVHRYNTCKILRCPFWFRFITPFSSCTSALICLRPPWSGCYSASDDLSCCCYHLLSVKHPIRNIIFNTPRYFLDFAFNCNKVTSYPMF